MNAQTQEKQSAQPATESFGERIRRAREERQLSIDDLVGETRIHPQHLYDLEQGKTSGISAPGYVVGYLRTLAKILELDAEVLISDFKSSLSQSDHQTIDPEHELLPLKQKKATFGWPTALATTIIVLAGIGGLFYYWLDNMRDGASNPQPVEVVGDGTSDQDETVGTKPPTTDESDTKAASGQLDESEDNELHRAESVAEGPIDGSNTDNNDMPLNGTGTEEQTNPSGENLMNLTQQSPIGASNDESTELLEETENDEQDSSQEPVESEETDEAVEEEPPLVFEFSDISFVEVTDADDNQLISETKQAGTTLELDGKAPFTVKLGFAPGVTLFYKGDKVDLDRHTRRNIAEFTLAP